MVLPVLVPIWLFTRLSWYPCDVNTHCSDVSGVTLSLEPLDPKRVDRDVNRGLGSVHVYQLTEFAVNLGAGNHMPYRLLAQLAVCHILLTVEGP